MGQHTDIIEKLREAYPTLTKSERLIANQIIANPERFALGSAAELANKAGVSAMAVTRLVRKLGFDHVSEIRRTMRQSVLGPDMAAVRSIRDRYDAFASRAGDRDERDRSLEAEIAALRDAYDLAGGPAWEASVKAVARSSRVYVHGLQVVRGLATEFASRLEFVRPNVYLADGQNGTFAEVVGDDPKKICLILIDIHRYAKLTQALAARASESGITTIVVSDEYCHWARDLTPNTFLCQTSTGLFWHSTATMSALLNVLVSDVVATLGDKARAHIDQVLDAQQQFGQFLDAPR